MRTTSYTLTNYEGTLDEIKGDIIENDANLIGLGLYDLWWDEFAHELVTNHGYAIDKSRPYEDGTYRVATRTLIHEEQDA